MVVNKILSVSLAALFVAGCASVDGNASKGGEAGLSTADRVKAAKDDRGHPARSMTEARLNSILDEYDANGDGTVTWSEYNDWRRARFDKTDANGNGTVDEEEYVYEYEERLDEGISEERERHQEQTKQRFSALDTDNSDMLLWSEYESSGSKIFAYWDCDQNAVINSKDKQCKESKRGGKAKKERRRSFAQMPTSHTFKGFMSLYDLGGKGEVSKRDFDLERRSTFHLTDENKDGKVSFDEYANEYNLRLDKSLDRSRRGAIRQTYVRFGVLDTNDNGMMTFDELQLSGKRIFVRWDKNGDGVISTTDVGVKD